ncbi:MAG: DUF6873 family GME fold protein [Romboutsia sp.]|uniref:DUF6873 family GME fold protein n=1 Tax=Romboutsia sp. TaxID=1965302 RepID=UPI003F3A4233
MEFVKKSFIVDGNLSLALVDKRITLNMENKLKSLGVDIIKTTSCPNTYNAIMCHPDISICKLNDNNIIVAPNVYDYYFEVLSNYSFKVIKGNSIIENKYPYNVHYNVCIFGNYVMHNFKYTDKKILEFIENNNLQKIDVEQGYSKCSTCIVDEKSIITSDEGIFKTCLYFDIDCLLIEKGHINLFDMNYGFIGGCSGLISSDTLVFYGDLTKHPDYEKILHFVNSKNKNIVCLSDEHLLDLGSLIPLIVV